MIITYLFIKMHWLTNSEAVIWRRVYNKHKDEAVTHRDILTLNSKEKALNKKISNIVKKKWIINLHRGKYFVPAFEDVIKARQVKPFKVNTIKDVRDVQEIPLAVGAPVANEMYWYPTRRPLHIYAFEKHVHLVESKHRIRTMTEEAWNQMMCIDGLHILSLEDTIIECLQDADLQSAMALAHRQKHLIDWSYLIKRIHDEGVEDLAYTSLDRFPQARRLKKYQDPNLPKMTSSFIKKVLRENKVPVMLREV